MMIFKSMKSLHSSQMKSQSLLRRALTIADLAEQMNQVFYFLNLKQYIIFYSNII